MFGYGIGQSHETEATGTDTGLIQGLHMVPGVPKVIS